MPRLYATELDQAILGLFRRPVGRGNPRELSRREVNGLLSEEPAEAIGRSLQRLALRGALATRGHRASTVYFLPVQQQQQQTTRETKP
jgi:hypothetical protein